MMFSIKKKTGFFPSCCCVNTSVWMHNIDANETYREKARREVHMEVTLCMNSSEYVFCKYSASSMQ